jgi:hypothetical protein
MAGATDLPARLPEARRLVISAHGIAPDRLLEIIGRMPALRDLAVGYPVDALRVLLRDGADHDLDRLTVLIGCEGVLPRAPVLGTGQVRFDFSTRVLSIQVGETFHRTLGEALALVVRAFGPMRPAVLDVAGTGRAEMGPAGASGLPGELTQGKLRLSLGALWDAASDIGAKPSVGEGFDFGWSPAHPSRRF